MIVIRGAVAGHGPPWPVALAIAAVLASSPVHAQTAEFMLRGFADVGQTRFAAVRSFETVLGSERGPVFGGGVEVVLPQGVFVNLRASRFRDTGERVVLLAHERIGLGIPLTVTVTPVEIAAGYRVDYGWRVVPYGGGGVGWHRYEEVSQFAEPDENIRESFRGFQLVGGAEFRVARWLATAFEAEWATVPDALGRDVNTVSNEVGESDLGGATLRVKIVVGR